MGFLDRFRKNTPAVRTDAPMLYYLAPNGKELLPVKAAGLNSFGYGLSSFLANNPQAVNSSPQGYALAYLASVWANRCVEVRCKAVSRIPWKVIKKRTKNSVDNHPLTIAINRNSQRLLRKIEWSQLLWGETFIAPMDNDFGYCSDLSWLNNLGVEIIQAAGYIQGFQYIPLQGGKAHNYKRDELAYWHTDNPFDDLRGISKFETVLLDIGVDRDMAQTAKSWYANGARFGLMLIPENDLSSPDAQAFMDYWNANLKGTKNANKTILSPRNIKEVKELNAAPTVDDVELAESVRRKICAAFGVPLSIAGAWDDAQYQSAPAQRKSLYEETIIPECEDIAHDITRHVLPFFDNSGTTEFVFDFTEIMALMEDTREKAELANGKLMAGGITLNEYRKELKHAPLNNGDVLYIPSTSVQVPLDQLGIPAAPAPTSPLNFMAQQAETGSLAEDFFKRVAPIAQQPPKPKPREERFGVEEYEIIPPDEETEDEPADKDYDPNQPRDADGRFGSGGGGSSGGEDKPKEKKPATSPERKPKQKKPKKTPEQEARDARSYRDFGVYPESMTSDAFAAGLSKPTDKQAAALDYYRSDEGAYALNRNLRTGDKLPPKARQQAKELDDVLSTSTLPHDVAVYRGITPDSPQLAVFKKQLESGELKVGSTMVDRGYSSTTVDKSIANSKFAGDGGVLFKINAPKGANGLYVSSAMDKHTGGRHDHPFRDEKEILLPRNANYRVTGIKRNGSQYEIEMTYDGVSAESGKALMQEHELAAWEKNALNKGAAKAQTFTCYALPEDVQTFVRSGLSDAADKRALKQLFTDARQLLAVDSPTPTPSMDADGFAELVELWRELELDSLVSQVEALADDSESGT